MSPKSFLSLLFLTSNLIRVLSRRTVGTNQSHRSYSVIPATPSDILTIISFIIIPLVQSDRFYSVYANLS